MKQKVRSKAQPAGNITVDFAEGTTSMVVINGDVTGITLANTNVTIGSGEVSTYSILFQNVFGNQDLDTTTYPSNWTNWRFVDNDTQLAQGSGEFTLLTVTADINDIIVASLTRFTDPPAIDNSGLANSNIIVNGTTIELGGSGNISNFGSLTTDDLSEGATNLYFTDATANTWFTTQTTDNLTEGATNQYFTEGRARASVSASGDLTYNVSTGVFSVTTYKSADFDTDFATKTTDDLTEGASNFYYTEGRFDTSFAGKTTDDLTEGSTNLYYSNALVEAYLSSNVSTIDADVITANSFVGGTFSGEGSDLTDVRAETLEALVKNISGVAIDKGYPLHVVSATGGGTPEVILADAGNAATMPAHFIAGEDLAIDAEGRGILSGEIRGIDTANTRICRR